MSDTKKCEASVHRPGYSRGIPCGNAAKVERDGKHYCLIHDPVRQQAKRDAQNATWVRERETKRKLQEELDECNRAKDALVAFVLYVRDSRNSIGINPVPNRTQWLELVKWAERAKGVKS